MLPRNGHQDVVPDPPFDPQMLESSRSWPSNVIPIVLGVPLVVGGCVWVFGALASESVQKAVAGVLFLVIFGGVVAGYAFFELRKHRGRRSDGGEPR